MEDVINEIIANIKDGLFVNEASVSQGIIQPILQKLGWNVFNPSIVSPEFSVEGGRVDFALCHPPNKPMVFIEVKQIGKIDGAERQLFEYAFHQGVPMAILTDGSEWQFFLPAEQGNYDDRRVYKLDLLEREIEEIVSRFKRYLNYKNICNGVAVENARNDYKNVSKKRIIELSLPEAWFKLTNEPDELLIKIIAEKTEILCGFRPESSEIVKFLKNRLNNFIATKANNLNLRHKVVSKKVKPINRNQLFKQETLGNLGYELFGIFYPGRNARDIMVEIFLKLQNNDPEFFNKFIALPRHGRTRRYLARSPQEVFPNRPDFARDSNHCRKIAPGYYMDVHESKSNIEKIIQLACEVADITYGSDLKINLGI